MILCSIAKTEIPFVRIRIYRIGEFSGLNKEIILKILKFWKSCSAEVLFGTLPLEK